MKISNRVLKNANITIVADKLHTSFLSPAFFSDILPNPSNLIQIPPFGVMDFGSCNFIVDVNNRRVIINHNTPNILDTLIPKMAKKFLSEVKGPEIIAIGFNFSMDLTCDSEFGRYSVGEFISSKYREKFGEGLSGIGLKIFVKKSLYNCTFVIEPQLTEVTHALTSANFHYEMPYDLNYDTEFNMRYNEFEEYVNGIFD